MRRITIGRIAAGGLAVCVLGAAGAGTAFGAGTTKVEGHYRTATATTGDVDETLALTGTIATATERAESFSVAGTVAAVQVKVGDTVSAGDVIATLDTDSLQDAVDAANDTLSTARQQLSTDLAARSSASSSSSGSSSGTSATSSTVSVSKKSLQQAIAALNKAEQALADCDDSDSSGDASGDDATSDDDTSSDDTSSDDTSTDATTDDASCTDTAEAQVQSALTTLERLSSGAPSSGGSSSSGSSAASSAASGAESSTPSSADITADRAVITAAKAAVRVAEANLDAHVLTAGISGTVAEIDIAKGDTVSAGTAAITIIGDDGYVIETTVPLTKIAKVRVDETATISLPALGTSYSGTVASVGVVNVETSSSTPAYDVTISVDADGGTLRYGSAATVAVAVASATDVLTVPLSAVTTAADGTSTVEVLEDGEPSTLTVTTGAVGTDTIEIDSGLSEGDTVVLADLDEDVPSSTSSSSTSSGLSGLTGGSTGTSGGFGGGTGGFGGTGRGNG